MAAANIERFNRQVLRAVAHLYETHPALTTLEEDTVSGSVKNPDGSMTIDLDELQKASDAIMWLHRNHVVTGDVLKGGAYNSPATFAIQNAQLTASVFGILNSADDNVSGSLGEACINHLNGSRQQVLADRLMVRLTNG